MSATNKTNAVAPKVFCQSCSMPIDDVTMRGTEKNGAKSKEYCKYCYVNGAFVNPNATLDDMRMIVKEEMEKRNAPVGTVEMALSTLPYLKRWRHAVKA